MVNGLYVVVFLYFFYQVLDVFGIRDASPPDLTRWKSVVEKVRKPEGEVKIAVVGKYMQVKDSYKSLMEALAHGGFAHNVRVNVEWMESEVFEKDDAAVYLEDMHGILVPGGFGERGTEGKIRAVGFARTRQEAPPSTHRFAAGSPPPARGCAPSAPRSRVLR